MPREKGWNPISDVLAESHPDAEDDFYKKFWQCTTIGDLHDLTLNAMHVEGRDRPLDWRRLERELERLCGTGTTHHGGNK